MAITLDAITNSNSTTPASPYTFSHTVGTGATILLVLIGNRTSIAAITGVTYAGNALTSVRRDGPTNAAISEIWYQVNPATGSNTVSIAQSAALTTISVLAVSLFGTDTSNPIDAHNGTTGTGNPSVDVTSTTDNCWMMDVCFSRGNPTTITQGTESGRTDWSPDWEYEPGGNEGAGGGTKYENVTSAGAKTFSWTHTGTGASLSGVAIKVASTPLPPGIKIYHRAVERASVW